MSKLTIISDRALELAGQAGAGLRQAGSSLRDAGIGAETGYIEVPIYDREKLLPGMCFDGPAIVEEREATAVIWPGDMAHVDRYRAIVVEVNAAGRNA